MKQKQIHTKGKEFVKALTNFLLETAIKYSIRIYPETIKEFLKKTRLLVLYVLYIQKRDSGFGVKITNLFILVNK